METVDTIANGVDDDSSVTTVNWERTAKAFEDELLTLRPLIVENRRLKRYMGGVRVLGRALKDSKQEVRQLRGLSADMALSPEHTTSTDRPQVTPGDESVDDNEDDIENNIKGAIEAEDVRTSPKDEDQGDGETMEDMELIGELSKYEGVCQKECVTALVNQSKLTQPLIRTSGECEVRNRDRESEIPKNYFNGEISKTGFEANESNVDTANTLEDPGTSTEALITSVTSSSKVLPHKEVSANVRSVATITNNENSFASTYLKQQEFSSLKIQVQELMKVNLEWKNHLREKRSEFIAELSEKDQTIGRLQRQLDDAVKEADIKANQYEQTLLTAKTRIEKIEDKNQGLKKDVSKEQQRSEKSEMLNRTLIKQNLNMTDEIMRLKQALEKKYHQHVHVNQSPSLETAATLLNQSRSSEPEAVRNDEHQQQPNIVERDTQTHTATVPMPLKAPADEEKHDVRLTAPQNVQAVSEKKTCPQENISKVTDKSLSKQDMKEQVELLRQQNQMYESDFKKERADRQKARNELHTLRHQLNKQKRHTKGQIKDDMKTKAQGPPKHGAYSPPDQKLESESTPRRDHNKLKKTPECRNDIDVVKHGQEAICHQVSGSRAIIIQTGPEGRGLQINLQAESGTVRGRGRVPALHDPFVCPKCQKLFTESEWDSFEHHVALCRR